MKKITAVTLVILFVFQFATKARLNSSPAYAKEVVVANPAIFSSSWNNPSTILTRDLSETADIEDFTSGNAASPISHITKSNSDENIQQESIENTSEEKTPSEEIPEEGADAEKNTEKESISEEEIELKKEIVTEETPVPEQEAVPAEVTEDTKTLSEPLSFGKRTFFSFLTYFAPVVHAVVESENTETNAPEETVGQTEEQTQEVVAQELQQEDIASPELVTNDREEVAPEPTSDIHESSTIPSDESVRFTEQSFVELSMFTIVDSWKITNRNDYILTNPRLVLSFANETIPDHDIVIFTKVNGAWRTLVTLKLDVARSNKNNNGFFSFPLSGISDLRSLESFEIKIAHMGSRTLPFGSNVYIDSVWIEAENDDAIDPDDQAPVTLSSDKKNFSLNEEVSFAFQYTDPPSKTEALVDTVKALLAIAPDNDATRDEEAYDIQAAVYDSEGEKITEIQPSVDYFDNNVFTVSLDKKIKKIIPGKYTLDVDVYTPDGVKKHQEEFNWGLLAINSNKSTYNPNETAYLHMAVLRDDGHTICDAHLSLTIITPSGQEELSPINQSGVCGPNNVIDTPDYFSEYAIREIGTYTLLLSNADTGAEITDSFDVLETIPFDIERSGPTRIFPPADYGVTLTITANTFFIGTIQERVPYDFIIKKATLKKKNMPEETTPLTIVRDGGDTRIEALVHLQPGEPYELTYTFDAPNISPYLFLIGPLNFTSDETNPVVAGLLTDIPEILLPNPEDIFHGHYAEKRQWQIASDSVGTIDPNGDGTTTCSPTPGGTHSTTINDGARSPSTPNTGDFISCAEDESDIFTLSTVTGAYTSTEISVFAHYINSNVDMQWEVELWDASETTQYGTTQTLTNAVTATWNSVTFTGLALTQSDLDGLRVKYTNKKTGGGSADTSLLYTTYAEVTYTPENEYPNVIGVTVNGGNTITLTENTTTEVVVTSTVSDGNGFMDLIGAEAKLYRAGATNAESCTVNDNDCYTTSCTPTDCSGNTCTIACTFSVQFHADPTDAGTPWEEDYWRAWVQATDSVFQSTGAYSAPNGPDVASLVALDVTSSTSYGLLMPGATTDPVSVTTTITATGNTSLDIMLYGSNMTKSGSSLPVGQQRYSTVSSTSFTSSTILLADPGERVQLNIPKATTSSTKPYTHMWLGIDIPLATPSGVFSGTITTLGVQNELSWP